MAIVKVTMVNDKVFHLTYKGSYFEVVESLFGKMPNNISHWGENRPIVTICSQYIVCIEEVSNTKEIIPEENKYF